MNVSNYSHTYLVGPKQPFDQKISSDSLHDVLGQLSAVRGDRTPHLSGLINAIIDDRLFHVGSSVATRELTVFGMNVQIMQATTGRKMNAKNVLPVFPLTAITPNKIRWPEPLWCACLYAAHNR